MNAANSAILARDTLQRHGAVHDRRRDKDFQDTPSRRVQHACRKCSQSKQRCDGKKPCNRCIHKNLGCSYRISKSPEPIRRETSNSSPSSQLPQSAIERNQPLDPENTCRALQNHQTGYAQTIWRQEYQDETRDVVSASTASAARNATTQFQFTAEANNFEPMSLMADCLCDISLSALCGPSQQPSAIPSEENVVISKAAELPGPPEMAYWEASSYMDGLYQDLGMDFGFAMPIDVAESTQYGTPVSEPDLGANVASPPAPSFLDARASPEPCEGQGLTYDDYVRKVFANRRHLHHKDAHEGANVGGSLQGHTLQKAHIPPVMGDFPPSLSSQSDDSAWEADNLRHVPYLPQQVYEQIAATFKLLNATQGPYIQFAGGAFPSLAACNAFMQLYFEEFDPLFPFLHKPTFNPSTTPWLLVLATISVGIRFAREPAAVECGDIMQEFLRRAFLAAVCRVASLPLFDFFE